LAGEGLARRFPDLRGMSTYVLVVIRDR
jgi:hypothetical protein